MTDAKKIPLANDGTVTAIAGNSEFSEQEIEIDREFIVLRLHTAYIALCEDMAEFQQQWDKNPALALYLASEAGKRAGTGEFLGELGEIFNPEMWKEAAAKVGGWSGRAMDMMHSYSNSAYNRLRESFSKAEKLVDAREDTIANWAWWHRLAERKADEFKQRIVAKGEAVAQQADNLMMKADMAAKIFKHRQAIFELPNHIVNSDVKAVQSFVDTVLMDIDPVLAKQIRTSPQFAASIALIEDHESVLQYMTYMSMMFDAIPPNFYVYCGEKFSIQLKLEIALTVALAYVSAGVGAAARLGTLAARFAAVGTRAGRAAQQYKRAQAALQTLARVLRDFGDAAEEMHRLGHKLARVRNRGTVIKGSSRTTIQAKKETVKRDTKCRYCGSSKHSTPRHGPKRGVVSYR